MMKICRHWAIKKQKKTTSIFDKVTLCDKVADVDEEDWDDVLDCKNSKNVNNYPQNNKKTSVTVST